MLLFAILPLARLGPCAMLVSLIGARCGMPIRRFALQLLRRHVLDGADDRSFDGSTIASHDSMSPGLFRFARCENAKRLSRSLLFDGVRPRAVLFRHLRCRNNSAAKFCKLYKLALDCL